MKPRSRIAAISAKRAAQHPELLTQGSTIARSSSKPKARKPVKKKRRSAESFARIYGSVARVRWIAARNSVVSSLSPCENVHVRGDGVGRKADAKWIIPLTPAEHRELHRVGKDSFEERYRVNLDRLARLTEAAWQATLSGAE